MSRIKNDHTLNGDCVQNKFTSIKFWMLQHVFYLVLSINFIFVMLKCRDSKYIKELTISIVFRQVALEFLPELSENGQICSTIQSPSVHSIQSGVSNYYLIYLWKNSYNLRLFPTPPLRFQMPFIINFFSWKSTPPKKLDHDALFFSK